MSDPDLKITPLDRLHRALGAKMVPFAGYAMPVQYPMGVLQEHQWTRQHAGLFDVSHMGQIWLSGADVVAQLETVVPGDIAALAPGRQRYTMLTAEDGGILDDLMITNFGDHLYVVVNAGCKDADLAHLQAKLGGVTIAPKFDRALLALQGPEAASVMADMSPDAAALGFMSGRATTVASVPAIVTRSGYTGEDGFEISLSAADAEAVANRLLADARVKPIGLGARDSLRLEAGLCLYGHDIDTTTSPIEAGLTWTISKRRRAEGGFPGAARIQRELAGGPARMRVGIRPEDKAPAREGTAIVSPSGEALGAITSGGFGPTVGGPIAMGYVTPAHAAVGTEVHLIVRGSPRPARVVPMPFAPHRYHRG